MKKNKVALITGINGQDGSYLSELLLLKKYEVHGIIRRSSAINTGLIKHIIPKLFLHYGDLIDANTIRRLIYKIEPDEIYNLAAQSQVRVSFDTPEYTINVTGLGPVRVLEAIKDYQDNNKNKKRIKFYQASSSEMFGNSPPPQNEQSLFSPRSPYGCAKLLGYHATCNYRDGFNIFAVNGILFNHESPRRGEEFVTRKITSSVAKIKAGLMKKISLGNLSAKRDWGYAPEYMEAVWSMMQQDKPDDYVIGTGESHSIKDFLNEAFNVIGISDWKKYVEIDRSYFRPTDVHDLVADYSKAQKKFGWKPKTKFKDLVKIMVEADLNLTKNDKAS